jgi:hypothetical protein
MIRPCGAAGRAAMMALISSAGGVLYP